MNVETRLGDDTNSQWQNPQAKNARAFSKPICNPSFTFQRMMAEKEQTPESHGDWFRSQIAIDFFKNHYDKGTLKDADGNAVDEHILWDVKRLDFAIGGGLVTARRMS